LKIAIFGCSDFSIVGGGERFTFDIARALDATIISYGSEEDLDRTYPCDDIKFKFMNKKVPPEPFKHLYCKWVYATYKPDEEYDFYIVMDDMSMCYLVNDVPHMYLMFTPNRAMYDMNTYVLNEKKGLAKPIYTVGLAVFRQIDKWFVNRYVKNIVGISHIVRNRIYKAYLRNSDVLYPCIDVSKFHHAPHNNYWLSCNRVDKWKRVELQVEAFRQLPDMKLKVAGSIYPEYEELVANAPDNVEFLGVVSEDELTDLYANCTGFLTTAIDEDFGITPLEAMASGKPVVATREGGYMETVIHGHTGIMVGPNADEIAEAILALSIEPEQYKDECIKQAAKFDYSKFEKQINKIVRRCKQ
jgi:glycosyltransferase involved in cell wall biosynthesis